MRPRKRVLLAAATQSLDDQYRLLLDVWGYALADAEHPPDAVLGVGLPPEDIGRLVQTHAPLPVVALVPQGERLAALEAGARFAPMSALELRDGLAVAVARRRGPKSKGWRETLARRAGCNAARRAIRKMERAA